MMSNIGIESTMYLDFQEIETFENADMETLLLLCPSIPIHQQQSLSQQEVESERCFSLGWDYKDDYDVYGQLEKHLYFSESLVTIAKRGQHLLDTIRKTKTEGVTSISTSVDIVMNILRLVIKCKLMGTCTLMNELFCYLDEVMFSEIDDAIDEFYIDDESYPITSVYYGHEKWLGDIDIQEFKFERATGFEEGELMLLACFFNDYLTLMEKITDHIDIQSRKAPCYKRLESTISKIIVNLERVKTVILDEIDHSIDKNIDP